MGRSQTLPHAFAVCLALLTPIATFAALPSDRKIEMDVRETVEARLSQSEGLVAVQGVQLISRENVTEDRVNAKLRITMVRTKHMIATVDKHGRLRSQDIRIVNAIPPGTRWSETMKIFMRPILGQWAIVGAETISKDNAEFERAVIMAKRAIVAEDAKIAQRQAIAASNALAARESANRAEADALARRDAVLIAEGSAVIQSFVEAVSNGEYARAMQLAMQDSSAYYQGRGDFRAGIGKAPTMPTITGVARYFRQGAIEYLVLATQNHGELPLQRKASDDWKLVSAITQVRP